MNREEFRAYARACDLANLGIVAPHKAKYYNRYNIQWLIDEVATGKQHTYHTFWQAEDMLSQWYKGQPIFVNGREYVTAEQYMMSEKALLFGDLDSYRKIMAEPDPAVCKKLGRGVTGFDSQGWDNAFREIIFHGNLAKLQSDIEIVDFLLSTEDAVLVEASPYDDIYGAGLKREDLLNGDGSLKVLPQNWHKEGSTKQAENNLGFVLMGLRDLFMQLMGMNEV